MAADPSPRAGALVDPDAEITAPKAAAPSPAMAERYGRTPRTRRQNRWIFGSVAAAFVLVFAAWVGWATFDDNNGTLHTTDTAHTVLDDRNVSVTFDVTAPVASPVACAVQALSERSSVVGWKIVQYPASEHPTRSFTETVRTTELATTGLIYRCWLS